VPELFETTNIKGMIIKNRFVRSVTWEEWQKMMEHAPKG